MYSSKNHPKTHSFDLVGEYKNTIKTIEELEQFIPLTAEERETLQKVVDIHPMAITPYYLSLIDPEDPEDPIRKLVVPSADELSNLGSYDPSGESENTKQSGLQHKYEQTALILTTKQCMAYCRFCFRKRFVGVADNEILRDIKAARNYVQKHTEITNVLLSGGDPLSMGNEWVERYLEAFMSIDHVDYVRIGTRVPVVLPQRISEDGELQELFSRYSTPDKRLHIVTHFNHPKEITPESIRAIDTLYACGVPVHNQTVLLKGINDNPDVLADLFNSLVSIGVNPYYLFQCRPVRRVLHFQLTLEEGLTILEEAHKKMSGLAKRFKYAMSHRSGKVEILGSDDDHIYFKYHQAKNPAHSGKFFKVDRMPEACWLDDFPGWKHGNIG
ncbi:KamA family radical SAM protein [archaeon]|nr:MAG: KamA family radical SAM protein [archaeon]